MKHIDFLGEHLRSCGEDNPIWRSPADMDFYKFPMGQLIWKHFPNVEVTFRLIVRDRTIPLARYINMTELEKMLDYARTCIFKRTDLYYLRGMDLYQENMFSDGYLSFLKDFKLPPYSARFDDGQLVLETTAPWPYASMWETVFLAIVSQLYYRNVLNEVGEQAVSEAYIYAQHRLLDKIRKIQQHPEITFADFGQRRRHSFKWQEWAIGQCKDRLGKQFVGTSNLWMAFKHDLVPIGTNAHELPMVLAALAETDDELLYSQYRVLELWQEMYGQGLRIFLPDTFGTEQFLANAPAWVADWRGMRQDSGDPKDIGMKYVRWLDHHKKNPRERLLICSDGLDVNPMIDIAEYFRPEIPTTFGWGTLFTNDFEGVLPQVPHLRPFSVVCKVVRANGFDCGKISDNPEKATGPKKLIDRYRRVFKSPEGKRIKVVV